MLNSDGRRNVSRNWEHFCEIALVWMAIADGLFLEGELPKDWYSRYIPSEGKKREIPGWEDFVSTTSDL